MTKAKTVRFGLYLIASAPTGGDIHDNPDDTACQLGEFATRDEAYRAGRAYLRFHPHAWVQVQKVDLSEDGEDVVAE